MAWTTPKTWAALETLTSTDMNTYVRDNTAYLKNRPSQSHIRTTADGDTSSTSTTFATIPSFSLSITPVTTKILVCWGAFFTRSGTLGLQAEAEIFLDSVSQFSIWRSQGYGSEGGYTAGARILTVTAGVSHTVDIRWKVASGATIVMDVTQAIPSSLFIMEI